MILLVLKEKNLEPFRNEAAMIESFIFVRFFWTKLTWPLLNLSLLMTVTWAVTIASRRGLASALPRAPRRARASQLHPSQGHQENAYLT